MTDPQTQHVAEMMSVPLEELLTSLGRGIGEAQAALDRHSIEIQRLMDTDPVLGQYGLTATWYQIPSTELTLKVAVALEEPLSATSAAPAPGAAESASAKTTEPAKPARRKRVTKAGGRDIGSAVIDVGAARPTVPLRRPLPHIWAQPVNARYQNQFGFEATASSTVSLTIVPVPPPAAVAAVEPKHSDDDVLAVVADKLVKAADGSDVGRVSVNFSPGSLTWYVLQTKQTSSGETDLITLLRVDDANLAVISEESAG